jgi:glycosyltransferase involved in cell wall biosynthesis
MESPLVSFVIPVFNNENDITRCLRSIQNQCVAGETCEIVILDNGSTDQTHRIMNELGFAFQVMPNVTVSALRNRGAALARGRYLAFVDSDVELSQEWLQNGLRVFADTGVVASGCFPGVPGDATWVQRTWDLHQRGSYVDLTPRPVSWLSSMNLIVRRDMFLAIGGFNERLQTAEDVDLGYRLGQRGTILCNPAMDAVHWGEARDLKIFWRKEVWRGLGNLGGVRSHGIRWDELPSLGYPLYTGCLVVLLTLGIVLDLWYQKVTFVPAITVLLILPPLLLALNTVRLAKHPTALFRLFLLYLVYGLARAYAVVKA